MENVILVDSASFFVNREDPRQVSYDAVDTTYWRPMMLSTWVQLPTPSETQIMYQLRGSDTRAAVLSLNSWNDLGGGSFFVGG
jgi:hypothetical protein